MNSKMTTHSQLSTTEPKRKRKKHKLSKQLEQKQNHRNGGLSAGRGKGGMREKVQGMSSTNGRYKIDRGRLRIA